MPQPAAGPATVELVAAQLSLTSDPDALVTQAVDAANAWVRQQRVADIDAAEWPADVELGTVMLSARLYRRRNSPDGVQAMTDAGAAYVARSDPDIAMLLQVGAYARPAVG